jgi:hypothetical protein
MPLPSNHTSTDEALLEMELKIARRADQFARELRRQSSLNLVCWLMAEAEVLGASAVQAILPRLSALG